MTWHSKASLGARHPIQNWEYADSTARLAATGFVADDVGKVAKQLDDDSLWHLTGYSPISWEALGGAGGGHSPWEKDEFSPTNGQITFILSSAPTDLNSLKIYVNGAKQDDVVDYTVSGVTITWLDNFVMEVGDKVHALYQ